MADDLELTIVIRAIDDASAVLRALATEIADDFNLIAAQAQSAELQINSGLNSIGPLFGALMQDANELSAGFSQVDAVLGAFDDLLVTLQQDARGALLSLGQLATAMGSAMDVSGGGGSLAGFDMSQMLAAVQGAPGSVQVVQNNTFNGILDPGAIRDQIIPELERAVTRGATSLAFS